MSTSYIADIFSNTGARLSPAVGLKPIEGEYTLAERDVGVLRLVLPPTVPIAWLQKDGRVQLRRSIDGGGPYLEGEATWLLRRRRQEFNNRENLTTIWALHVNHLLARRIVAYAAGSTEASKAGAADDMIKEIVDENFVNPTDATRTMSGLTVQGDLGAAPATARSFSRRNVMAVLQDICDDAASVGTYLGFEVRTSGSGFQLVTYTQQRGVDRRAGSGNYLRVSPSSGAIASSSLDEDWSEEVTYMYSLGQGLEAARATGSAQNAVAEGASPFGRIEDSYQANNTSDQTTLDVVAASALYAARGRIIYEAVGQESPGFRYGRDYRWGDLLTVTDFGQQFNVRVNPVHVTFGRQGEQIDTRLTYDNTGLAV
jgi:hypothetical protein